MDLFFCTQQMENVSFGISPFVWIRFPLYVENGNDVCIQMPNRFNLNVIQMRLSVGDGEAFASRAHALYCTRRTDALHNHVQWIFMANIGCWHRSEIRSSTSSKLPSRIDMNQCSFNNKVEHTDKIEYRTVWLERSILKIEPGNDNEIQPSHGVEWKYVSKKTSKCHSSSPEVHIPLLVQQPNIHESIFTSSTFRIESISPFYFWKTIGIPPGESGSQLVFYF